MLLFRITLQFTTMNVFLFRFTSFKYNNEMFKKYYFDCDNTFKPWDTRRLAVTEPIPELAPVTSATFPR